MATDQVTVTIELVRRRGLRLLARVPGLWCRHYRIMRRCEGRIVSAYAAWLMASRILLINGK